MFLITQPAVKSELSDDAKICGSYSTLKKTITLQIAVYLILLYLIISAVFLQQHIYPWIGFLFLYPLFLLYHTKKKCVIKISSHILFRDFDTQAMHDKTLYQISEEYSRKYKTLSLVDAISALDKLLRKAIILVFISVCFVYPLGAWYMYACLIISSYVVYAIANTSLVYKRLR